MTQARLSRIFWAGAAATLVVATLVGIAALGSGDFDDTDWKILGTLLALLIAGGTAVAGLTLAERHIAVRAGYAGAGVAAVGFVVVTAALWTEDSDALADLALTAAVAVPAVLILSTQRLLLRDRRLRFLLIGSAVTLGLATLLTTLGIWGTDIDEGGWKITAALWILGALGWVLVPVLQRVNGAAPVRTTNHAEHVVAELGGVELVVNGAPDDATVSIEPTAGGLVVRNPGGRIQLQPGESIVLRKRLS